MLKATYILFLSKKETKILLYAKKATNTLHMVASILKQFKKHRIVLGLKQHDMLLRVGISRQQYQQLESKGNPRLNTLELVAEGLKGKLMFIPQEKLNDVKTILETETKPHMNLNEMPLKDQKEKELANDPWKNVLDGEDER